MVRRTISLAGPDAASTQALGERFARIRADLRVPDGFPPDVLAAASAAAAQPPAGRPDRTDVPFVTVDPPGSTDLDQAMYLQRRDSGFRVAYAIADVPAFVAPDGPVDGEARHRG